MPNVLLHNKEGKFFTDVTASSGTGDLHKGHGVAFADLNNDGDEDLLDEVGGAVPGDSHAFRLFENPGNGNDWINLRLVGVKTNRARHRRADQGDGRKRGPCAFDLPHRRQRRLVRRVAFAAAHRLGKGAQDIDVEIWWPVSNTKQRLHNVPKNQFLEIKELTDGYQKLERHSFALGGAKDVASTSPKASPANSTKQK